MALTESVETRQGKAIGAKLAEDPETRGYFGAFVATYSEDGAEEAGERSPSGHYWLHSSEEERLPSGFAMLRTTWAFLLVMPRPTSTEAGNPWWRHDRVGQTKAALGQGELTDEDGAIVADYRERFDRVDFPKQSKEGGSLRTVFSAVYLAEISENTREYRV